MTLQNLKSFCVFFDRLSFYFAFLTISFGGGACVLLNSHSPGALIAGGIFLVAAFFTLFTVIIMSCANATFSGALKEVEKRQN